MMSIKVCLMTECLFLFCYICGYKNARPVGTGDITLHLSAAKETPVPWVQAISRFRRVFGQCLDSVITTCAISASTSLELHTNSLQILLTVK